MEHHVLHVLVAKNTHFLCLDVSDRILISLQNHIVQHGKGADSMLLTSHFQHPL